MVDNVAELFVGYVSLHVLGADVHHVLERNGQMPEARDVGRDERVGLLPQWMICGKWLWGSHVERGASRASTSASLTTRSPLPALAKMAPGFMRARKSAFTRPRVWGVLGKNATTTSA